MLAQLLAPLAARRRAVVATAVLAAALGALAGSLAGRDGEGAAGSVRADAVPLDGRSPREPAGTVVRVLVELGRPALGALEGGPPADPRRQRAHVASLREEGESLRSALDARDVQVDDVLEFARVFNGFAATIAEEDLPELESLGVRAEPVRRFYPAVGEPVPVSGATAPERPRGREPEVALLASGVTARDLPGRVRGGHDVVDGDSRPAAGRDPRDVRARETAGTALAGALAAAGADVVPMRVASLRPAGPEGVQEMATTDTLLMGLERAVDPDGDGSTADAIRVALAGVSAPYAGFPGSPEATAVAAAARLGTLVVAPAGHEGPGEPGLPGTVGSPGAAVAALTVAAGRADAPLADLSAGGRRLRAAVLGGSPTRAPGLVAATLTGDALEPGETPVAGSAAVVEAGADPARRAARAAAAGARLVILADPREGARLPAMPAGRVPVAVLGVTGDAARDLLDDGDGRAVRVGRPETVGTAGRALSAFSSRGPTLAGTAKPDLAANGGATTIVPGGASAHAGGAGVAAARAAAAAARLAAGRPEWTPAQLKAALMGAAETGAEGDPHATGAGWLAGNAAARARASGEPDGRPVAVAAAVTPPPVPLGPLELDRRDGVVAGVTFALGAFERPAAPGGPTRILAADRLVLELVDSSGRRLRTLTPAGSARDLLPAEYAYELPRRVLRGLEPGEYAFRARARTAGRDDLVTVDSERFSP